MFLIGAFIFVWAYSLTNAVQVTVKQGILEGEQVPLVTEDGYYYSYKGIPYAAPPVGELRFQRPFPPLNWTGVRDAKIHGNVCVQDDLTLNPGVIVGDEDCLFLNVYTPTVKANSTGLPVMIWFHGGGYVFGSGDDNVFGPDYLIPHNIVLVTFNYRVGPLGFLNLDTEEVPGNAGLKDQVAVMKWVQENIDKFGGNPKNVTIFGQSAGSVSISLHMLSPLSKGLFHRAIAISGTAYNEWTLPFLQARRAFALGKLLGMDTTDKDLLLSFLRNINATQFVYLQPNVLSNEEGTYFTKTTYSTYAVEKFNDENTFLNEDPMSIIRGGGTHNVDVMFIQTNRESINFYNPSLVTQYAQYTELFAPTRILNYVPPQKALDVADNIKKYYFANTTLNDDNRELLITYFSDINSYDVYKYIEHLDEYSDSKKYLLQLSAISERTIFANSNTKTHNLTKGVGHSDDWFYQFHPKNMNMKMTKTSMEYNLVQKFTTLTTNFAKYGHPTPSWTTPNKVLGTLSWPEYSSRERQYLDFGTSGITIQNGLRYAPYSMLDSVYEAAGICY